MNNWTSVQEIVDHMSESDSICNITKSIVNPGGSNFTYKLKDGSPLYKKCRLSLMQASIYLCRICGPVHFLLQLLSKLARCWLRFRLGPLREMLMCSKTVKCLYQLLLQMVEYPGTTVINLNATLFESGFHLKWVLGVSSLNAFTDM